MAGHLISMRALAIAAALAAPAAQAQVALPSGGFASNVITFGDSLSDGGNFKANNPGAPAAVPYMGPPLNLNRFTNGVTWAELLARSVGAPPVLFAAPAIPAGANANLAFGFARADTVAAAPTAQNPAFFPTIPGLSAQIASFRAKGGTFGPNSLVTVWAGANDIFQAGAGYPNPAAAAVAPLTAAQNVAANVNALIGLGARTIVVNNLPNLGALPDSITNGPAAVAGGAAASNAFNNTLAAAFPSGGGSANVILVDVAKAFADVTANPGRYGVANVTQGCVLTPACAANPAVWNTYAFWDGVHPTQAGHNIIASLALDYLNAGSAGLAMARLANLSRDLRTQSAGIALDRLMSVQSRERLIGKNAAGDNEVTLQFDGQASTGGGQKASIGAIRFQADRRFTPEIRGGAQFAYSFGKSEIDGIKAKLSSFSGDLYAGYAMANGFFANGSIGISFNRFDDIERKTLFFGTVNKSGTNGTAFNGLLTAGYAFRAAPSVTVSPYLGLEAFTASFDAFQEQNSVTAALAFRSRTYSGIAGLAGLRADVLLGGSLIGHVKIEYAHALARSQGTSGVSIVGNPSTIQPVKISAPNRGVIGLGAGLSGALTDQITVGLDYRASIQSSGKNTSHQGRLSASMKF